MHNPRCVAQGFYITRASKKCAKPVISFPSSMPGPVGSASSPPYSQSACEDLREGNLLCPGCVCGEGGVCAGRGWRGAALPSGSEDEGCPSPWGAGGLPGPGCRLHGRFPAPGRPQGSLAPHRAGPAPSSEPPALSPPPPPAAVGRDLETKLPRVAPGAPLPPAEGGEGKGQRGSRGLGRPPARRVRLCPARGRPPRAPSSRVTLLPRAAQRLARE